MSRSFLYRVRTVAGIVTALGATLSLATLARPVHAEPVEPQNSQTAAQPSSLRVTGTSQKFTVEADHADVQKVLKSLFDQANKQFDVDNTVAGQITLRLTDQTLETVLKSVSKQTFLRYHQDPATGIYHFEQDPEAIKESFTHLDTLNTDLRQQLRALGLDLPGDAQLDHPNLLQNRVQAKGVINGPNGDAGPKGAAGLGGGGNGQQSAQSPTQNDKAASRSANGNGINEPAPDTKPLKSDATKFKEGAIILPDGVPMSALELLMPPTTGRDTALAVQEGYLQFLRQNSLVAIYTNGAQYPMTDVLKELARQANVPILIDPSVPNGRQFRINLNLPPHTLEEALNIILPPSRLRWRMIGSSLYITPTANFQVFYGSPPQPYVIYGNSANNQSQQSRGLNNSQQTPTDNSGQNNFPK